MKIHHQQAERWVCQSLISHCHSCQEREREEREKRERRENIHSILTLIYTSFPLIYRKRKEESEKRDSLTGITREHWYNKVTTTTTRDWSEARLVTWCLFFVQNLCFPKGTRIFPYYSQISPSVMNDSPLTCLSLLVVVTDRHNEWCEWSVTQSFSGLLSLVRTEGHIYFTPLSREKSRLSSFPSLCAWHRETFKDQLTDGWTSLTIWHTKEINEKEKEGEKENSSTASTKIIINHHY